MFRGSIVAIVTPFKSNFEIDFEAFGRLIDFHLDQGTDGIVPCGCTGEAATLSHEEQKECIRYTIERVAGRVQIIAGTGSNNTKEAIELTNHAADLGADGSLLITPYYNKPTPEGLKAHYTAIAKAAKIPIVLYNVPSRTGIKMAPETIRDLSEIEYVTAIKEACGSVDQVSQIRALCDITVLSGDDPLTLPMMSVGATGVISVAANVAPAKMAGLCAAFENGNTQEAQSIHYELMPLFKGLFFETNPMPVKAVLAKMGFIENVLRLPLTPMQPKLFSDLEPIIERLALAAV